MEKYTQKHLRSLVNSGAAIDLTNADNADRDRIMAEEGWLKQIGYAAGMYGCSGLLFVGMNSGKLYAVTSRTSAIYIFS